MGFAQRSDVGSVDLETFGLVAVYVEPEAAERFNQKTSYQNPIPPYVDCSTPDCSIYLFRRPANLPATDDYDLEPGISIQVRGRVALLSDANLDSAAEMPPWLTPSLSDAGRMQPANDNEREEEPGEDENDGNLKSENEPVEQAPASSEEALALQFATAHRRDLRYVPLWGRWFSFDDGMKWRADDTLFAYSQARGICRRAAVECNQLNVSKSLASAKTVSAVITLSKADPRLVATTEQWDADPWLLNTPGGVVDLRNGKLRRHEPQYFATKITGAAPDANCAIPTWLSFLHRITGGDDDLISFLKRMSGYSITGLTSEHALFFCYGTGANGKSTFVDAISKCAGDYHKVAPIETFTDSKSERHPTELAGLRGARLVTAIETEEGRRWAESKIKALTGGDKIPARFMRQDFFEYTPQFKLVIAGTHKPGLRSVDEAIRRRFHLIPFTVTIPKDERDKQLPAKLASELPGILAWMIEGSLEWQTFGLRPPKAVSEATAAYLDSEDSLAAWIDECCERDASAWESSGRLFESWVMWSSKTGEIAGSQKRFSERLESKGIERRRTNHGRGFIGLKLRRPYEC